MNHQLPALEPIFRLGPEIVTEDDTKREKILITALEALITEMSEGRPNIMAKMNQIMSDAINFASTNFEMYPLRAKKAVLDAAEKINMASKKLPARERKIAIPGKRKRTNNDEENFESKKKMKKDNNSCKIM